MPRASTHSLLTLDRYAKIMGLDPMHFAQGFSDLRPASKCDSIWMQYDWQDNGKVSREQLAEKIDEAERDLADQLGYWPAPVWIENERRDYPRPQRTDLVSRMGRNIRDRLKSVKLRWGYVVQGGQRATTAVTYLRWTTLDLDGDGFSETARFTIDPFDDDTMEECEIHAYFKEYSLADAGNVRTDEASEGADPAWEIPIYARDQDGTALNLYIWVWNLFDPQLQEAMDAEAIDADTAGNYVDDILLYRVYTDPEDQVEFLWASDGTCDTTYAAAYTTEAGAFNIRDKRSSLVVPEPATYDSTTEMFTPNTCWTESHDPDYVRFWYLAGYTPERAHGCEDLDNQWAQTIAMLATARLSMPLCSCSAVRHKVDYWQEDLSLVGETKSFSIDPIVVTNPFGTRRGEVEAWKRLVKARGRQKGQAILV